MIAVVDYGLGNLRSVSKALEAVGAEVRVTSSPEEISAARAVILPGVGAFQRGMQNINKLGLAEALYESVKKQKPFLGICLGLQLLFSESQEHGISRGLDIIKGQVKKFTGVDKIPHMGWNQIKIKKSLPAGSPLGEAEGRQEKSKSKIFEGIPNGSYFYFVHSYYVEPEDKDVILATTGYGRDFVSAIKKDNLWGVQFHPEKSSTLGLKLLENFCGQIG